MSIHLFNTLISPKITNLPVDQKQIKIWCCHRCLSEPSQTLKSVDALFGMGFA